MPLINFFTADKGYSLKDKTKIKKWIISEVILLEKKLEEINIIFCSDDYLLDINKKFLDHDYYTDVITFDNSDNSIISGEIYISVDRIKENAKTTSSKIFDEFIRIMIHGVLHLMGFKDKTKKEK